MDILFGAFLTYVIDGIFEGIFGFFRSLVLSIGMLALGIYGHIKDWNMEDGR